MSSSPFTPEEKARAAAINRAVLNPGDRPACDYPEVREAQNLPYLLAFGFVAVAFTGLIYWLLAGMDGSRGHELRAGAVAEARAALQQPVGGGGTGGAAPQPWASPVMNAVVVQPPPSVTAPPVRRVNQPTVTRVAVPVAMRAVDRSAEHRRVALAHAEHHFRYDYRLGSGHVLVQAVEFSNVSGEEVPGWSRRRTAGVAGIAYVESVGGGSFRRLSRRFEVLTEERGGEIHAVEITVSPGR